MSIETVTTLLGLLYGFGFGYFLAHFDSRMAPDKSSIRWFALIFSALWPLSLLYWGILTLALMLGIWKPK